MSYNVKECYIEYLNGLCNEVIRQICAIEAEIQGYAKKRDEWTPETKPKRKTRPLYKRPIKKLSYRIIGLQGKLYRYKDIIDDVRTWLDMTTRYEPVFNDPLEQEK